MFSRRFSYAVAFHGLERVAGDGLVLIGGMASPELKDKFRAAITTKVGGSNICVQVAGRDDHFNGDDPCNIVNRLTIGGKNGVQIEQSESARGEPYGDKIAEAVADVYRQLL